jgi:hypothetical protein
MLKNSIEKYSEYRSKGKIQVFEKAAKKRKEIY